MSSKIGNKELFRRIKVISNSKRFRIIELTQDEQLSITELSSLMKLSYNKCADYVTMLEKEGLVIKTKEGKEIKVKSRVIVKDGVIEFSVK